ncbi:MAG: PAS domain S-box protein [Methanobacterium sp.]
MSDYKILIVEDEFIEAMSFEQSLKSFGYDVVNIASTGEEALENVSNHKPDLILMDIFLKGEMDGIEAAAQIKKNFDIPIVYLTAHLEEIEVKRAKLTSPYGYIIKPVNKTDLKNIIELTFYKHQLESKLKNSEAKYRSILENVLDAYIRTDTEGRIIMASPSAARMYRFDSIKEMIGSSAFSLYKYPEDRQKLLEELEKDGKAKNEEGTSLRKDGTTFWVSTNAQYYYDKKGRIQGTEAFIRDINESKNTKERINKLYRLYATLSQINQLVMRIKDRKKLFKTICEICIEYGKFEMAWIGLIDHESGNIKPIAYSGHEDGYLENISINIRDSPSLDKPSVRVINEGKFSVAEDLENDLDREWREEALKRNYRSLASIPLKLKKEVIGILNIYSSNPDFFKEDEINLVKEMGLDISLALDSIETRNEQELMKKDLKESDERYSLTVEAVNEGFWDWNVLTGEAYFNPIYYNMLGYDDGEFPASYESFRSLIHPDDVEGFEKELQHHIDNAEGYSIEVRLKTKDDKWCWILSRGQVVETGEDGKLLRMVGTHTDITDRKIAENVLKESEQRLSEIIEFLPDATFAIDNQGKVISWNHAIEEMTGVKADNILGKGNYEYALPFYGIRRPMLIDLVLKSEPELEEKYSLVKKVGKHLLGEVDVNFNGKNHSLWAKAVPLYNRNGKYNGAIESIRDITDRKKAEDALSKSEERFRAVAESAVDAIVTTDLNGVILFCNYSLGIIFGYSKEEIIGKNLTVLMPDRFKKDYLIELERFKVSGEHRRVGKTLKTLGLRNDGKEFPFEMSLSAWKTGKESYFTSIIRDITERKQMEDKLYQVSKEWERTFNAVPDLITIIDNDYHISRVNNAMAESLGVEPEACIGLICYEAVHGSNEPHILCPHRKLLEDGLEHTMEIHEERLGGDFIVSVSPLYDDEGNLMGSVHVARNINPLKNVEKDLRISIHQKDLLIKEIHHRVKNNLQIISSLLYLQEDYVKEDFKAVNVLQESQNRVSSMALLHEMLYQSEDLSQINFSEYIKNLVSKLFNSYSIKNNITPIINVDNICLNMETAVPCGLIISELVSNSLKYAYPDDSNGELIISLQYLKNELELIISDDGVGFPENLDFRNIKSSLGLKLVNSLVKQLDGSIELGRSRGAKFKIKFKELKYKQRI